MGRNGQHENEPITAASIRKSMEQRFEYLRFNDLCYGNNIGEFDLLETVLCEEVIELDSDNSCEIDSLQCNLPIAFSGTGGGDGKGAEQCAGPAPAPPAPRLLTGGFPCTLSTQSPVIGEPESFEYSHAGFDGGVAVGFQGAWNPVRFDKLIETLEQAKELAIEATREGQDGYCMELCGEEVLISPKGGLAGGDNAKGGVVYKYRFHCKGVEFMIHSKPSEHIQPVRIRYGAESVQGHRDKFYAIHFGFVLPFLKKLGLHVTEEKLSRVDMQCLIDVSVDEFAKLLSAGHVVTKLRKKALYGTMTRVETIEIGSIESVQFCIYDKGKELRSKKSEILKSAIFMRDCVGPEWYKSKLPITRVEIRLGRAALKCLGVDSVSDLQEREHSIIDLLTTEWFRILENPKVRGHENTASCHPIWERVRNLLFSYFTGKKEVAEWKKPDSVVCDPEALEKQALGCLSKAFAMRHGEQAEKSRAIGIGTQWVESVGGLLCEKINLCARQVLHKTGIELGDRHAYACFEDYMLDPRDSLDESMLSNKRAQIQVIVNSIMTGGST